MESSKVLVCNIPQEFRSADLRNYFSDFVETGKFTCFHFRHKPQSQLVTLLPSPAVAVTDQGQAKTSCVVELTDAKTAVHFRKKYHLKNWINSREDSLTSRCVILPIIDAPAESKIPTINGGTDSTKTSHAVPEVRVDVPSITLSKEDSSAGKPPLAMPQGNVGTPTRHFLEEIQKCRLPGRLVGRLGLRFGGRRPGRYGSVPFDYERLPPDDRELQEDEEEEWDRHEALHDNVTEQERAKERLYEEEQEVTWEKGGPGIVWYTDACRWKEDEGDFDEQTADDWDVDVGVYYRDGDGDKDARDALEMRQSTLWRQGVTESVFRKPSERPAASFSTKFKKKKGKAAQSSPAGSFEQYTRGIGRRLMERQGWKDGLGLGPANAGIVKPVDSDGQTPRERKGFGYSAPPPVRFGVSRSLPAIATEERVIISTVYDRPAETDPAEPLHQRNPTNFLKYRS